MPVTTRGQAAREAASEQSPQTGALGDSQIVSEHTRIIYNVGRLGPEARKRVEAGLNHAQCRLVNHRSVPEGMYFAFQLAEQVTIRFGRGDSDYPVPICSCGAVEAGLACKVSFPRDTLVALADSRKHIFWLEDLLVHFCPPERRPPLLELRPDGSAITGVTMFDWIRKVGLDEFVEFIRRHEEEAGEPSESQMDELIDMLSVFEPAALPEEFEDDDFGTTADETYPSREYKQFGTLIAHCAARDERMLSRLREVITPALQANVYTRKVSARAKQALEALADSIGEDPSSEQTALEQCAESLKQHVSLIQANYDKHHPNSGPEAANKAVTVLVYILEQTVMRRGLYDRLIGHDDDGDDDDGDGLFVLHVLSKIPPQAVETRKAELSRVFQTLHSYGAPAKYLNALRGIALKRTTAGAEPSSGKRVMR